MAVEHCRDAWALVLEHVSGWSLVYSGDTRPCKALAAAGRGCTILIHEATFEPDLINQAIDLFPWPSSPMLSFLTPALSTGSPSQCVPHMSTPCPC